MRSVRVAFWLKLVGVWALAVGVAVLLAEGGARLFVADPRAVLSNDVQTVLTRPGLPTFGQAFDYDADLFWVLKPNLSAWEVKGSLDNFAVDFRFSTTASRLRAMPALPGPEQYRILALGDSCTFGFGVNDEESWPAQLQTLLNAGRSGDFVRGINAGVPGYTAFQGLQFLKRYGLSLEPHLVLVSFWANDQIHSASISDEERAAQYATLRYDTVLMHSRLYAALKRFRGAAAPIWSQEKPERPRLDAEQYERTLREINNACAERGIRIVFVQWPIKWQVTGQVPAHEYQNITSRVAASVGAPVIALAPAFAASPEDSFIDAIHGTSKGCAIAAQVVAAAVARMM